MARLTIVQFAGDYREAFERFARGGLATYQAQRYSVGFVGDLASRVEQVAVIYGLCERPYDELLANGVRAIGLGFKDGLESAPLIEAVAATRPTHLAVTTPYPALLAWAASRGLEMMAPLADSFSRKRLIDRWRGRKLARLLNGTEVRWVGNHGLNACLSLLDIGVAPEKIVPWDWPPSFHPGERPARRRAAGPLSLGYVGSVCEAKGVGDLVDAVAILRQRGIAVTATIYGPEVDGVAHSAAAKGLSDAVRFAGPIPNEQVPDAMRASDAVVVPSRHGYPEGLPLTIYEALAARTPIIASDHPMFRGALKDGQNAVVFRASDPADLAAAIERLGDDAPLYERLSVNTAAAWEALQLPVTWGELLVAWLERGEEGRRWLRDHSIASGRYDLALAQRRSALRNG